MINIKQFKKLIGDRHPTIAIMLGSGLGDIAKAIKSPLEIKYKEIENFPESTVKGHIGKMIIGTIGNKEVLCLQGRFHLYEGYPSNVIYDVIHALKKIGIKEIIITNASGSLNPNFRPGGIMIIKDHINFSGQNPLININNISQHFNDMSNAYDEKLSIKAKEIATNRKIAVYEGVYLMVLGPSFETPAEVELFRHFGADAIGMSTVPEVIAAVDQKIKVVAFSALTNFGAGMKNSKLSHAQTLKQATKAANNLAKLITYFIEEQ